MAKKPLNGRVNDLVRGQHNARIAHATGLTAPVAKAAGAVARNPGKAGLAAAAITGAVALMTPSKAKADGGKSEVKKSDAKTEPAMSPGEILSTTLHGVATYAGGHVMKDFAKDRLIVEGRGTRAAMRVGGNFAKAAGVLGIGIGLLGAVQGAMATSAKIGNGSKTPEPAKDRTDPYTDRLGRNYAQGRKITRE